MDLPDPGIELGFPALQADSLPADSLPADCLELLGKPGSYMYWDATGRKERCGKRNAKGGIRALETSIGGRNCL